MRFLTLALLFLSSLSAWAYQPTADFLLNGAYHPQLPLEMRIVAEDGSNDMKTTILHQSVRIAMERWNEAMGKTIFKLTEDTDLSGNFSGHLIRFATGAAFLEATKGYVGVSGVSTLAVTKRRAVNRQYKEVQIILNGSITKLAVLNSLLRDPSTLITTLVHELGHTIGLGHNDINPETKEPISNPPEGVMASVINPTLPVLDDEEAGMFPMDDDVRGMNEIIRETDERQKTNSYASDSDLSGCAAGTVAFLAKDGPNPPGSAAGLGFFMTLVLGFLATKLGRRFKILVLG